MENGTLLLEKQRMIGIDQTKTKNYTIQKIDYTKLLSNNNVRLIANGKSITASSDLKDIIYDFDRIEIKDGKRFNILRIGVRNSEDGLVYSYNKLVISLSYFKEHNLNPATQVEELNMINEVVAYLRDEYGIYMIANEVEYDSIEVNLTMALNEEFRNFKHLFTIMSKVSPNHYKNKQIYDTRIFTGIVLKNKSIECSVYDKTRELADIYDNYLNKQWLRIEFKLKISEKIKAVFGSNKVKDITDDLIRDYVIKQIYKDLIDPLEQHIDRSNKQLLRLAKQLKSKHGKAWVKLFIAEAQLLEVNNALALVDVKQIKDIIKQLSTSKNYRAILRRNEERLLEITNKYSNFDRLQYIKDSLFLKGEDNAYESLYVSGF